MKNSFSTKNHKKNIFFTSDEQNRKFKITREFLPNLNSNPKNSIPFNINIKREELLKKEISILDQIWDELEIIWEYREAFSIYVRNMNDEYKQNIILQEKNNLKKYKKALINLKKEISIREDNILLLKRYNNRLDNFNNNDQLTNIIEAVINLVQKLRINAINIVKEYSKIENISKNYSNLNKITKKIIKTEYSYDPNYLYKMQDDLLFLKESTLSKYFEMDNKYIDPFLTNFCSISKDTNKATVSNSTDIIGLINESRYILLQKKMFDKISQNNNRTLNIENDCFRGLSRNFSTKINKKIEYKKNNSRKEIKLENYLNQIKLNCPSKYSQLFIHKKNTLTDLPNFRKQINISQKDIKHIVNSSNMVLITRIKEENNELRQKIKLLNQNITINYYTGDINTLLKTLEDKMPLNKIPLNIKTIFNLDESIYKKEEYIKGVFPKILILTNEENIDKNDLVGLCFFYYEWKEGPKCLKLKIDYIISNDYDNYEKYIEKILDFIKINMKFDKIEIILVNNESTKDLIDFFQTKLKFKWSNIIKEKKNQIQTISFCYQQNKINDLTDIFNISNKSILCLDKKEKLNINEELPNNEEKYMNKNNIYYMLLDNKNIKCEFQDESKMKEVNDLKNELTNFSKVENNFKIKEEDDIKKYLDDNKLKEINNNSILYEIDLKLNVRNCFSLMINNIYYNKISSDTMQVYQEEKTKSIFYLIPIQDSPFSINICQVNSELKNLLIDNGGNKSLYENFLDFNTNTKFNLLDQANKTIYIPSFIKKKHFFSRNFEEIEKNIKIAEEETKSPLYFSSLFELINIEFKPDSNLKNNFIDNENCENDNDYIIKNDFIISIVKDDNIKDNKLTLIQILYIEKDNFLTKENYNQ